MQLVLIINKIDNSYQSTMDSPDQGAKRYYFHCLPSIRKMWSFKGISGNRTLQTID